MLAYYISDIVERLSTRQTSDGWEVRLVIMNPILFFSFDFPLQEIEGSLHCLMAVQEAVPVEDSSHLRGLFSPDILNRLPSSGGDRVRRTTVNLIGNSSPSTYEEQRFSCCPVLLQAVTRLGSPLSLHTDLKMPATPCS